MANTQGRTSINYVPNVHAQTPSNYNTTARDQHQNTLAIPVHIPEVKSIHEMERAQIEREVHRFSFGITIRELGKIQAKTPSVTRERVSYSSQEIRK